MIFAEDEETSGRLLSDAEYTRALRDRGDIFFVDRGFRLRIFVALAILAGTIVFPFLRGIRIGSVAADNHRKMTHEETVQTGADRRVAATLAGNSRERDGREKSRETRPAGYPRFMHGSSREHILTAEFPSDTHPSANRPPANRETGTLESPTPNPVLPGPGAQNNDTTGNAGIPIVGDFVGKGNAFAKRGDHAHAFAEYDRALERDPRNTGALAGKGDLFLATGLLDSALASYQKALAVNPRMAPVHKGLGSVRYYLSVLAANPHYIGLRNIPDAAQYIRSQYDSAIAEYTEAISLDSTNVDALTDRGVLRDVRNDHAAAIEDYSLAIRINPAWADAYCKRAATYAALRRYREAIDDYTAAIRLDSGSYDFNPTLRFANAYFNRGIVFYKTRQLARAIADYDSALALSPNHSLAILNKAIALDDEKQHDSAIAAYTRAIALLGPDEYGGAQKLGYLHRGNAYKALGHYDKAIGDYTVALESPKLAARACWRIAECYSMQKDDVNAIIWLKKSIDNGFADFKAWRRDRELAPLWNEKEFIDIAGR